MMRHIMALGSIGALALLLGGGFLLARRSRAALEGGVLLPQVNRLVAGWEARKAPPGDRALTIMLDDAQLSAVVARLSKSPSGGGAAQAEELAVKAPPSFFGGFGSWFGRTFFRGELSAGDGAAFAGNFQAQNPVVWEHNGFEDADEEEMARELMKSIIRANEAGAEVNIITRGAGAAAALTAVKRLEKLAVKGRPVAVNKLVALHMNKPTLKKLNPVAFGNFAWPSNLKSWVNVWQSPVPPKPRRIELYTPNHNGDLVALDKLLPALGLYRPQVASGPVEADLARFIDRLLVRADSVDTIIGEALALARAYEARLAAEGAARAQAEKAAAAEAARKVKYEHVASRDLMGRAYDRGAPAGRAGRSASGPQDSLSAIGGGWLKDEMEKSKERTTETEQTAGKTERQAQTQTSQADNRAGNAGNCKGNPPRCNWYDAKAYCGGRLPSVAQLQAWYNSECAGGRKGSIYCGYWVWSGEESGSGSARYVTFGYGYVNTYNKAYDSHHYVRCR